MTLHELTPEQELEATRFALERERIDNWLGLRDRVERTGRRDAQLLLLYEESQARMDALLDKYAGQLAMREAFENVKV